MKNCKYFLLATGERMDTV